MKLALLGKGGSGKSTISWLLSQYLSQVKKYQTLAIDADHNMDLSTCLGINPYEVTHFKDFNDEFRQLANMPKIGMWKEYFKFDPVYFTYPQTENTGTVGKYLTSVNPNLDLIVLGLGDEEIMNSYKCSHALTAPVKHVLPTLKMENGSWLVLDSVAGSDMVNYGLYFAFDCIVAVVEGNINSIKVAKQLCKLINKQGMKLNFILNKYNSENNFIKDFQREFKDLIIGKISTDSALTNYDFSLVTQENLDNLESIVTRIKLFPQVEDSYQKLKIFEENKVL
jgi:CO dehydrogenase maturation factor